MDPQKGCYWKWVPLLEMGVPFPVLVNCAFWDLHMDRMTEQMAQMVAPVKTTAWGGPHGSLALVLDDTDYDTVTKNIVTLLAPLSKPTKINTKIRELSNPFEILTLQEEMKTLQKEFELQEAVTTIGVQGIINSIEEQYVEELNEDYFGHANQKSKRS